MAREPCCSIGYGGPYQIPKDGLMPGCRHPAHIYWLPKGYAPTHDDFVICVVAEPPGENWAEHDDAGAPPLLRVIAEAIEKYMREKKEVISCPSEHAPVNASGT